MEQRWKEEGFIPFFARESLSRNRKASLNDKRFYRIRKLHLHSTMQQNAYESSTTEHSDRRTTNAPSKPPCRIGKVGSSFLRFSYSGSKTYWNPTLSMISRRVESRDIVLCWTRVWWEVEELGLMNFVWTPSIGHVRPGFGDSCGKTWAFGPISFSHTPPFKHHTPYLTCGPVAVDRPQGPNTFSCFDTSMFKSTPTTPSHVQD